jgi:hypothetical protein|tara:strand:+ start:12831 stop:13070 length:240 start_codon:yes stop_codon:yes gene_type:complete
MKVNDITNEWMAMYDTMKAYGLSRAKHPNGSGYFKITKDVYHPNKKVDEKWSDKYKKSINCSNPKGFSQKAHCAGKKKK